MSEKIVVGLSGGVDSSVAAFLLQEQGYDVECIFMKNWEDDDSKICSSANDYNDALEVCEILGLPLHSVNFSNEYWIRFLHISSKSINQVGLPIRMYYATVK